MVERRKRGSLDFVATMCLNENQCATIQAIINQTWQQKCPCLQHEMSISRKLFHSDKRSSGHFAHASVRKRPVRYCLKSFRLRNNPGALHIYIPPSFSPDTKMSDTHVYTLFFNPLIRLKKLAN